MALRTVLRRCLSDGLNVNKYSSIRFASSDSDVTVQGDIPVRKDVYDVILPKDHISKRLTPETKITVAAHEDVGLVSGVPEEHIHTRTVRIYQPPKNAMQSGTNNVNFWQIDFDTRERWENPLIGWTSTGDPHSNIKVDFASQDEAIEHCKKMGWRYYVQKPNEDNPKSRTYGQNFSWNKRTRVSTK